MADKNGIDKVESKDDTQDSKCNTSFFIPLKLPGFKTSFEIHLILSKCGPKKTF